MVKKLKLVQLIIKPKNRKKLAPIFLFFLIFLAKFLQIHGLTCDTSMKKNFFATIKKFPHNYKKITVQL